MMLRWMPRLVILGVMAIVGILFSLIPGDQELAEYQSPKLEHRITARLNAVPLSVALQQLASDSGLPIRADWSALRELGIREDAPVTADLTAMRVSKAIRYVLDAATPDAAAGNIWWHVERNGEVVVTTTAKGREYVIERRYNVRHYTYALYGVFRIDTETGRELTNDIIKLVQDTVASDTWKSNGGDFGEIRYQDGYLYVTQLPENHRSIAKLLEQLNDIRTPDWLIVTLTSRPPATFGCFPAPPSSARRP